VDAQHRFLHDVFGVGVGAGHPVGDAEQARSLGDRDLLEHRLIHRPLTSMVSRRARRRSVG
jgi:hypothetical protein